MTHVLTYLMNCYCKSCICRLLLLVLLVCPGGWSWGKHYSDETEAWLVRLDEEIAKRETINQQKREELEKMQLLGSHLSSLDDVYRHNSRVYECSFTFDSELAMEVIDANLSIARQLKDLEKETDCTIKRSFILAATGQLLESSAAVSQIEVEKLSHRLKVDYYGQCLYLAQHLSQYSWNKHLKELYDSSSNSYSDSLNSIIAPTDDQYLWYKIWNDINSDHLEQSIGELKAVVDTLPLDKRYDAMLCYGLAHLYKQQGDQDRYIRYLAQSGVADIRSANQDIASIEELAGIMYDLSKLEKEHSNSLLRRPKDTYLSRAYEYINVSIQTARIYNNLVRTVSITPVMDNIIRAYQERDDEQKQTLTYTTVTLSILFLIVVGAIIIVLRQKRDLIGHQQRLRQQNELINRQKENLHEANTHLTETNLRLQRAMEEQEASNLQLREANYVKEEYIGYVFSLCSNYISKLDEYRKEINRKAKVKQIDEILTLTDKSSLVQDELKEFYHNFDALFLNVYPDFIRDFNGLLDPAEAIEPRKGELLNTDLRIYALVRLGITDSVKIAEFLHVSPQTVYNNRLKIRNKAIVPKEEFVQHVRNLGHPHLFPQA